MSYEGEIVAAPVIIGVLAVAGTVKAVGAVAKGTLKVATAAGRAVNSAVQTARFNAMDSRFSDIAGSVDEISSNLDNEMENAREKCAEDYAKAIEKIAEECEKSADMSAFTLNCNNALNNLCSDISAKRNVLENECIGRVRRELSISSGRLEDEREEILKSIDKINDDIEKKNQAKFAAEEALNRAASIIDGISARYENCKSAQNAVNICNKYYEKAEESLKSGNYQAALIGAYSVMENAATRVSELAENEMKCQQRYIDATMLLKNTSEIINKFRTYDYTVTKKGVEKTATVDDFTVYYRGEYENISNQLRNIENRMTSENFRDYTPENLEDFITEITNLNSEFLAQTTLAAERFENERTRRKTAKHIVAGYIERGYETIPLTDEERAISPLDAFVLKFRNAETDDTILLRLNAVEQGGHIITSIDITDHTDYSGSLSEIEEKRERERELNCEIIKRKVGGNMKVQQRCKNMYAKDRNRNN